VPPELPQRIKDNFIKRYRCNREPSQAYNPVKDKLKAVSDHKARNSLGQAAPSIPEMYDPAELIKFSFEIR
jgi:hypothetical protein